VVSTDDGVELALALHQAVEDAHEVALQCSRRSHCSSRTFFVGAMIRSYRCGSRPEFVDDDGDFLPWFSDRMRLRAKNQIAFADVIVLNKTDLVSKAELAEVEARIRALNPYAKLHRTERCKVALSDVLERGAFDLDRILEIEPEFLDAGDGHDHGHDLITNDP